MLNHFIHLAAKLHINFGWKIHTFNSGCFKCKLYCGYVNLEYTVSIWMRGVSLVPIQVAWEPGYEDGYEASEQYSVTFKQPLSTLHDETQR